MEVAGLAHNLGDAWKHPRLFFERGLRQHEEAVDTALEKINSTGREKKLPALESSAQELYTDTDRAVVNSVISNLYALNKATTGALGQIALRATGVSLRDEANFQELQGLAQKYKDILGDILSNRIGQLTKGGDDLEAREQGLKGFATEVLNSLKILGDDQFIKQVPRRLFPISKIKKV